MRSPGGGAAVRLVLALAVVASCVSVAPAFARGTKDGPNPAAAASAPPVETMVFSRAPRVAVDSVARFLIVASKAAVVAVRAESVTVERRDSAVVIVRLVHETPEHWRNRLGARTTMQTTLSQSRDRILTRIDSAGVSVRTRNRLRYRV